MGFYMTLLVVHPRAGSVSKVPTLDEVRKRAVMPVKDYTLWRAEEALAFGRVTRIEKVEQHSGKEVAGICIASYLFEKLTAKKQAADKRDFAPLFAVGGGTESCLSWEIEHLTFETLAEGQQFVRPLNPLNARSTCPALQTMQVHNKLWTLSEAEFQSFVRDKYDVVLHNLLMWESCGVAFRWLSEMEGSDTRAWRIMGADQGALCYWRAWKGFLSEMEKLGARVLFVFDHSADLAFL